MERTTVSIEGRSLFYTIFWFGRDREGWYNKNDDVSSPRTSSSSQTVPISALIPDSEPDSEFANLRSLKRKRKEVLLVEVAERRGRRGCVANLRGRNFPLGWPRLSSVSRGFTPYMHEFSSSNLSSFVPVFVPNPAWLIGKTGNVSYPWKKDLR